MPGPMHAVYLGPQERQTALPTARRLRAQKKPLSPLDLPTRQQAWARLRMATADAPLDVLVIGGGATGCGAALDAASRCVLQRMATESSDFPLARAKWR